MGKYQLATGMLGILESSEAHHLVTEVELLMTAATCLSYTQLHQRLAVSLPFIPAQALKITKMHPLS